MSKALVTKTYSIHGFEDEMNGKKCHLRVGKVNEEVGGEVRGVGWSKLRG